MVYLSLNLKENASADFLFDDNSRFMILNFRSAVTTLSFHRSCLKHIDYGTGLESYTNTSIEDTHKNRVKFKQCLDILRENVSQEDYNSLEMFMKENDPEIYELMNESLK